MSDDDEKQQPEARWQGSAHAAPYGLSRLAPSYDLVDVAAQIQKADETLATIARVRDATGELIDPHTAVGVAAMRAADLPRHVPRIALATAHPAKFPDAVERATGVRPGLPPHMADLFDRPERVTRVPNDLAALQALVRERIARR